MDHYFFGPMQHLWVSEILFCTLLLKKLMIGDCGLYGKYNCKPISSFILMN